MVDSPDLAAAKRLLDAAKDAGFAFQRIAPGEDAPLRGVRQSTQWLDEIHLGGLWAPQSCTAIRRRRSSLVVPGGLPVAQRVSGDALTVCTPW
jgi:hypothetical protein